MLDIEIGVYNGAFDNTSEETVSLNTFIDDVRNGTYKDKVQRLRQLTGDPQDDYKKTLPAVTLSGTFKGGRKEEHLHEYNYQICIDFDHLTDLEKDKEILKGDLYSYVVSESVSGKGLFVIVRLEPIELNGNVKDYHVQAYLALEKYYKEKYGFTTDKACKDINRLRYVSYDPDIYINDNPAVFSFSHHENFTDDLTVQSRSKKVVSNEDIQKVREIVEEVEKKNILLGDDSYDNWLKLAFALSRVGEEGRGLFHKVSAISPKYDSKVCDDQYDKVLNKTERFNGVTIATFFHYAQKAGINISMTAIDGEEPKNKPPTQAEIILKQTESLTLFHDENNDAYAFLDNEAVLLRSRRLKQWLSRLLYEAIGKAANSETLNNVIGVLEGKAIYDNPEKILFNRIAGKDGVFWYDLGSGQAVKIADDGWSVVEAPIIFKRYSHQQVQITPIGGGNPWKIFEFLNVDNEHQLLVLIYVISCFIPDIPHPIFHPHGPQGAGKTTFGRVLRRTVDPSNIETLITPRDLGQLVQTVAHHHVCIFDNLSSLSPWMSDILAQACTGGGFSKRQLYTDDEDVIYKVKRCIGLNGINLTISKPDLMDRSILLHLERIDTSKRIEEKKLWEDFEIARPMILGGILDVIAKAMKGYSDVKLSHLPRMADFAKWGYAIAEAMGGRGDEFLKSYQQNVERQNEEVVQSNTLAQVVLTFMADKESWDGTINQAWEKFHGIANPNKHDTTFPKTNRSLRSHLERIKTNLMDMGITYKIGVRTKEGYPITFQKVKNFASFGTPDCNSLSNKDLAGEAKVKQNVPNEFGTPLSTPAKSLQNKELYQGEANVSNSATSWDDLTEVEI